MTESLARKGWLALLLAAPLCCGGLTLLAAGGFGAVASLLAGKGFLLLAGAFLVAALVALGLALKRRGKPKEDPDCCE